VACERGSTNMSYSFWNFFLRWGFRLVGVCVILVPMYTTLHHDRACAFAKKCIPLLHKGPLLLVMFLTVVTATAAPHKPTVFLLDAPVNATWAANHGEMWRQKGFRGFFFEGLVDDLAPYPSEMPQSKSPVDPPDSANEQVLPGDWESLITEISGAVNRLRAAGLDRNFLRLSLLPEAPYFTDNTFRDIAMRRLKLAGECCRRTGLHGIALDTQSQSGIFDYRWDGHPEEATPEILSEGARRFGRSLLRTFIREFPEGEILLLAQRVEMAGPLWYAFFEGSLESVGAAATVPIRLILYDGGLPEPLEFYQGRLQQLNRMYHRTLSVAAYERWERQGGVSFSLEPIRYEGDMPVPRYPLGPYRHALCATALNGNDYTIIHAPQGGWWHIPPDLAAQFPHLRQAGRARVSFSPPVPVTVDAYAPRLPIAGALHLGTAFVAEKAMEVLQHEEKTALLSWDGLSQELRLPARTGMITVTDLVTDTQGYFTPSDEMITVPVQQGLLLIEGAATTVFAVQAGMNMQLLTPIYAGVSRSELAIAVHNPLSLLMDGALTLNTTHRYALGAMTLDLRVAAGTSTTFQRTLQGISYLGQRPLFSMNLHFGTQPPVIRTFTFPVEPPELFCIHMDGSIPGPPLLLPTTASTLPRIIAGDMRGGLVCFNSNNNEKLWHTRSRGIHAQPPVMLQDDSGAFFLALQNTHGRIRIFNDLGEEKVIIYGSDSPFTKLAPVHSDKGAAVYLAAAAANRTITIYAPSGILQNRFSTGDVLYLASAPTLPGRLYVVATEEKDAAQSELTLSCYDLGGHLLWHSLLPAGITCLPAVHATTGTSPSIICVSDTAGVLSLYDAEDGSLWINHVMDAPFPVTNMAALGSVSKGELLLATSDSTMLRVHALSENSSEQRFATPLPNVTALTPAPQDGEVLVGLKNGDLYGFHMNGKMLWEDHQGVGSVTGITPFTVPDQKDTFICTTSSEAGLLRGLEIRGSLIRPDNR
jgi:outer membrane protein assembly factor BamB